jgi:type I restriction enzyme M protein
MSASRGVIAEDGVGRSSLCGQKVIGLTFKSGEMVCDAACGAGETIRRKLMQECDVHTPLRLPTGLFYAQGVKANVIFFDKKPASETPWTKKLWIYDLRTNKHFTLKTNPLKRVDLDEFVTLYNPANRHDRRPTWSAEADAKAGTGPDGRWRVYDYEELVAPDRASLDIFWRRDDSLADSDNLPPPAEIAREIIEELEAALEQFRLIEADLQTPGVTAPEGRA